MKFRHILDDKKSICVNESQYVTPLSGAVIDCPQNRVINGIIRMKSIIKQYFIYVTIFNNDQFYFRVFSAFLFSESWSD